MKSMPLNLKDAKKIHTDGKSSTFQLKSGHQIKIVHAALPALHKKQVETMPVHKYAGGGYADPSNSSVQPEPYDYVTNDDPNAPGAPPLPGNDNQGVPAAAADQDSDRAPAGIAQDIGAGIHNALAPIVQNSFSPIGTVLKQGGNFIKGLTSGQNTDQNQDGGQSSGLPPAASDLPGMGEPVGQPQGPQPASAPSSVMPGGSAPDISVGGIYQTGLKGLQAQQQAETGYGQQAAQAEQAYQKQMDDANARFQAIQSQNNADIDQTVHDMRTGAINPNHYVENMSVPSKIATAIGMILGGAGAGAGRPNPGAEFLNAQINRDIDAQKANLGEQNNILGAFQQKYGNNVAAESAARAAITANYASQLRSAADNTSDPMAKARLLQGQSALMQQVYPLMMKANGIQFLQERQQQRAAGGSSPGVDYPSMTVMQRIGIMPPPDVEAATKEAQAYQNHANQTQAVMSSWDQANKENTVGNRTLHAGFEPASVSTLQTSILPFLKDAEGRINEQELARTDGLIPRPGDGPAKIAEKRAGMEQFLQEKNSPASFPTLSRYGLISQNAPAQQAPQYRVGQILYNKGQKIQIIDNNGNYRAVR